MDDYKLDRNCTQSSTEQVPESKSVCRSQENIVESKNRENKSERAKLIHEMTERACDKNDEALKKLSKN
jgi:hypothetical protein